MRQILLTGSSGFLGAYLIRFLASRGHRVLAVSRNNAYSANTEGVNCLCVESYGNDPTLFAQLNHADVVIHLAARVHVMNDTSPNPLEEFRQVNTHDTLKLAREAANRGVKRFIYLSSIKVLGESTEIGQPFTAEDPPKPIDPYAISKLEAEQALLELAKQTAMEVVIIRPPLVYGPAVKGNFASMIKVLKRGLPLPLAGLKTNRRSLVSLQNLCSLIEVCCHHPQAANQIFLASDGHDLSTADLLNNLASSLGCRARLFFIPQIILALGARLLGKQAHFERLAGSLQVSIEKNRQLLGWTPPVRVDEGFRSLSEKADLP